MVLFTIPVEQNDDPNSNDTAAVWAIWQDTSEAMTTRINAARSLADAGNTDAMTWLWQEFRRQEPAQLTKNSLSRLRRFVATPELSTTGLTSLYAKVGDQA